MHHPPFATGIPVCDEVGLADPDRLALTELVARHPEVRLVVAGHTHRTIMTSSAGRPAMTIPSTYAQTRLTFAPDDFEAVAEPPAFALHTVVAGDVVRISSR